MVYFFICSADVYAIKCLNKIYISVFHRFNETKYLNSEILISDMIEKDISEKLTLKEKKHINSVLEVYSVYSGIQLEDMSHKEMPWIKARKGYSPNQRCEVEIDNDFLGEYFRKRIK